MSDTQDLMIHCIKTKGRIYECDMQAQRIAQLEAEFESCNCLGAHTHCNGVCKTCFKPVVSWKDAFETAVHAQENFPHWMADLKAERDELRKDAERYQKLWQLRDVTLLTAFFGNGCVNKTRGDVEKLLDAAAMKEKP